MFIRKPTKKTGFTLVEMIVVIVILAITTAVAVPSVVGFIETGKQTNRMNIARTIYLASQNQLVQKRLTKNLVSFSKNFYQNGVPNETDMVYSASTGVKSDNEATENKEFVRYIKKPKTDVIDQNDSVIELLSDVIIDEKILKNAICIEYNINTGIVLSVFYSDIAKDFQYGRGLVDEKQDLSGERPYTMASERKQGYYGSDSTGVFQEKPLKEKINLYDGDVKPFVENGKSYTNILYAEIFIPKTTEKYNLQIFNTDKQTKLSREIEVDFSSFLMDSTLIQAVQFHLPNSDLIYKTANPVKSDSEQQIIEDGVNVTALYNKYIWVLDYVGGDMLDYSARSLSIGENYRNSDNSLMKPQNICVGIKPYTAEFYNNFSESENSHYGGITKEEPLTYLVKSARHLNNIRYLPNAKFCQTKTINMQYGENKVTNFEPIKDFGGEYSVLQSDINIENLVINIQTMVSPPDYDIGLFANIINGGKISGISVMNAKIFSYYGGNVGTLVGNLENGFVVRCKTLANVTVFKTSDYKQISAGGMIGNIGKEGRLELSYNGGFVDANTNTISDNGIGSVIVKGVYANNVAVQAGGIVGTNSGIIKNVYNNARVNIYDVQIGTGEDAHLSKPKMWGLIPITAKEPKLGGIAGLNTYTGKINNTYATNYVASYGNSSSGGIVGENLAKEKNIKECYYIENGCTGKQVISKKNLRKHFNFSGNLFKWSGNFYWQGNNVASGYPYPVLRNLEHTTGYEDIKEINTADEVSTE